MFLFHLLVLSTGTPLHQPEEDQQILPNALQQQQQQTPSVSQVPPLAPMGGLTPTLGLGMGHAMTIPQTKYVPGFGLPMSSLSGQTPVSFTVRYGHLINCKNWTLRIFHDITIVVYKFGYLPPSARN